MGEPKPVNFRHELKYLISSAEVTMLRTRLSGLIFPAAARSLIFCKNRLF